MLSKQQVSRRAIGLPTSSCLRFSLVSQEREGPAELWVDGSLGGG